MTRYAIYAAPERDTRLWHFGNRVLGRDAETGSEVSQIVPDGFQPDDWQNFTASPRRYGFHATMKAPFRLKDGKSESDLFDTARAFAKTKAPIESIELKPVLSGDYVMLGLKETDRRVHDFADDCVSEFDAFRAPLTNEERSKRGTDLSAQQKDYLEHWGYPYVFEDFTFHLTLAGPLPKAQAKDALTALTAGYAQAVNGEVLAIRSVCVFAGPEGEPFRLVLRIALGCA
jgi:hypothetical protein